MTIKQQAAWWTAAGAAIGLAVIIAIDVWRGGGSRPPVPADDAGAGADTLPEPPPRSMVRERMEDPEYMAALHALVEERRAVAIEQYAVRRRILPLIEAAEEELRAEALAARDADDAGASPAVEDTQLPAAEDAADPVIPEAALKQRVAQHPEWPALESELLALERQMTLIQRRAEDTIRERMSEQYALRREIRETLGEPGPAPVKAPPEVRRMDDFQLPGEPVVLTNVPAHVRDALPAVPDRRPVGQGRRARPDDSGRTTP